MRDIVTRIRDERVLWGMTQGDLAEATGIDRDKIGKIETGVRQVSPQELVQFARVFEVTLDDLVHPEPRQIHFRVNLDKPATQQAIAWFERCMDNSQFVRRLEELYAAPAQGG